MSLLLVTATALEMEAVLSGLMPAEKAASLARSLPASKHCATRIRGRALFLLLCGVGPVSAGLSLGFALGALRRTSLRGVLNLGIAGSYDETLAPIGSVVCATCEVFPEFGLRSGLAVNPRALGFAQNASPPVFDRIPPEPLPLADLEKRLGNMGLNCHTSPRFVYGPGVTVSGVSGDPECATATARHTGGLMENMEGFALALGAARWNLPFVELRAVSNTAGYRPPQRWDIPCALAALTRTTSVLFASQETNGQRGR